MGSAGHPDKYGDFPTAGMSRPSQDLLLSGGDYIGIKLIDLFVRTDGLGADERAGRQINGDGSILLISSDSVIKMLQIDHFVFGIIGDDSFSAAVPDGQLYSS